MSILWSERESSLSQRAAHHRTKYKIGVFSEKAEIKLLMMSICIAVLSIVPKENCCSLYGIRPNGSSQVLAKWYSPVINWGGNILWKTYYTIFLNLCFDLCIMYVTSAPLVGLEVLYKILHKAFESLDFRGCYVAS